MGKVCHHCFMRAYGFKGSKDPGSNSFSLQAVGRVVFLVAVSFYGRNSLLLENKRKNPGFSYF